MNNPAQDSYQLLLVANGLMLLMELHSIRSVRQLARNFPLLPMRHVRMLIVRLKLHGRHLRPGAKLTRLNALLF